jgi:type II secretory pathway pseudopilin PulG
MPRCRYPEYLVRSASGMHLVELLISVLVGGILMTAVFSSVSGMYKFSTGNKNNVMVTSIAQQVIDAARNTQYPRLRGFIGQTQDVPLYDYPGGDRSLVLFPRPVLRNDNLTYASNDLAVYGGQLQANQKLNGTCSVRIEDEPTPDATKGTAVKVTVVISWLDGMTNNSSPHTYSTSTIISQNGIHN